MRLYYCFPLACGFLVIVYYLVGGNFTDITSKAILSFFSLICMISASYVLNDVCDIQVDKINCPDRMLVSGKLKKRTAFIFSMICFGTGIILGWFCSRSFFVGILIISGLLICYDVFSKKLGILKAVFVAILTTSLYPLTFALTEPVATLRLNVLYILPFWLFLSSLGYEMLKDVRDIKGDSQASKLHLRSHSNTFLTSARIIIVLGALISPLPFILGYCKLIYLISSLFAVLLAAISIFNKPTIAIRCIYMEIFLVTAGSMVDMLVYGP